jgi:hypothetical protein
MFYTHKRKHNPSLYTKNTEAYPGSLHKGMKFFTFTDVAYTQTNSLTLVYSTVLFTFTFFWNVYRRQQLCSTLL